MGNQVVISILTDHLRWIEEHPQEFVDAIKYGMNDGIISQIVDQEYGRAPGWQETPAEREAAYNGVIVHKYQHADIPQIIYDWRNDSEPVHELPYAIEKGWIELHWGSLTESRRKLAKNYYMQIAKELTREATRLRKAVRAWEAKHDGDG